MRERHDDLWLRGLHKDRRVVNQSAAESRTSRGTKHATPSAGTAGEWKPVSTPIRKGDAVSLRRKDPVSGVCEQVLVRVGDDRYPQEFKP